MKRRPLKNPVSISEILGSVLKYRGLGKKIAQYSIFESWAQIVGPTISKQTTPKKMQGNVLIVAAKNAAWAQELSFMKPMILKKIHEMMGGCEIEDIRFTTVGRP